MDVIKREPVNIYQLVHRSTGEKRTVLASTFEAACSQLDWAVGDTYLQHLWEESYYKLLRFPQPVVILPCEVCSFQWSECLRPPDGICPCNKDTPDYHEWLVAATKSHVCHFIGPKLLQKDHRLHQKRVIFKKAVKILTSK